MRTCGWEGSVYCRSSDVLTNMREKARYRWAGVPFQGEVHARFQALCSTREGEHHFAA